MIRLKRYLNRMIVFLAAVVLLMAILVEPIRSAFLANVVFNGIIAVVLVVGITFVFRQVLMLRPEVDWLRAARRHGEVSEAPAPPRLLGPLASLIGEDLKGQVRMSAMSLRSLLDGVASRLEEGREISRYLIGLLIFLGLLGTFWGLLGTIGAIGDTIQNLSVGSADITLMFDDLKRGLQAPLEGMGTAFSSSLFGLAGSVILGFLDLQAGQAQSRFYNDLEDWLTSVTKLTRGMPGSGDGEGAAPSAYIGALLEQTADALEEMQRALVASEEDRAKTQDALVSLNEGVASLTDRIKSDQKDRREAVEYQRGTIKALERIIEQGETAEKGLDEATRGHLRSMDLNLKRLVDEQSKMQKESAEAIRSEMKLLARTLASAVEGRLKRDKPTGTKGGGE